MKNEGTELHCNSLNNEFIKNKIFNETYCSLSHSKIISLVNATIKTNPDSKSNRKYEKFKEIIKEPGVIFLEYEGPTEKLNGITSEGQPYFRGFGILISTNNLEIIKSINTSAQTIAEFHPIYGIFSDKDLKAEDTLEIILQGSCNDEYSDKDCQKIELYITQNNYVRKLTQKRKFSINEIQNKVDERIITLGVNKKLNELRKKTDPASKRKRRIENQINSRFNEIKNKSFNANSIELASIADETYVSLVTKIEDLTNSKLSEYDLAKIALKNYTKNLLDKVADLHVHEIMYGLMGIDKETVKSDKRKSINGILIEAGALPTNRGRQPIDKERKKLIDELPKFEKSFTDKLTKSQKK